MANLAIKDNKLDYTQSQRLTHHLLRETKAKTALHQAHDTKLDYITKISVFQSTFASDTDLASDWQILTR